MRSRHLALAALLAGLLVPLQARAFQIEGTGDLDIDGAAPTNTTTIVSLAGFELQPTSGGEMLVLFTEYGPSDVRSGRSDRAGQLFIELPTAYLVPGVSTRVDFEGDGVTAHYEEWDRRGTLFAGRAEQGSVDVRYEARSLDLLVVDAVVTLSIVDGDSDDERMIHGVLFGGEVPTLTTDPDRPRDATVVRRHDSGCHDSGDTVIVVEQDYETDSGCGGSEYDTYESDESGCGGDDLDSGGSSSSSSGGCDGDDLDSGSSSSSSSDDTCEGDDLDKSSASAATALAPLVRKRGLVGELARRIHLTLPLLFLGLTRSHFRRRETTRDSGGKRPSA